MGSLNTFPAITEIDSADLLYVGRTSDVSTPDKKITIENLNKTINQDGVYLSPDRKAFQELTSGILSTSGWYTIAEAPNEVNGGASAYFTISAPGTRDTLKLYAEHSGSGGAKTIQNTTIKILSAMDGTESFYQARLAKSDSVNNAGAKVQIKTEISLIINALKTANTGKSTGWELVPPYLDNTPTLPDGVTVATFIEAGAEYSTPSGTTVGPSSLKYTKITNDTIRLSFNWNQIPKQGTSLSLLYTTFSIHEFNSAYYEYIFDGSESIGSPTIHGNEVFVDITKVAAFANFTVAGTQVRANGLVATIS